MDCAAAKPNSQALHIYHGSSFQVLINAYRKLAFPPPAMSCALCGGRRGISRKSQRDSNSQGSGGNTS